MMSCYKCLLDKEGHKDQRYKGTKIQKHKETKIQKHKETKIQKHKETKTQRYKGTKKQRHITICITCINDQYATLPKCTSQ